MKRIALCLLLLSLSAQAAEFTWRSPALTGVNDNDVLLTLDINDQTSSNGSKINEIVSKCWYWEFSSTAGAFDVFVSMDGTNWLAAESLTDRHSTTPSTTVLVTAANGLYGWVGKPTKIRFMQNGATAVANGNVTCSSKE